MGDYKKLRVWEESCRFADRVEQMATELPQPERRWSFEQLVPAAHAIHENLAEGWDFDTHPQRLKFCRQARATGNEREGQLLARHRQDLRVNDYASLPTEVRSICAMLGKHRLLDHLNHFEGRFLPMLTANRTIHTLVNKRMIVGIEI